MYHRIIRRKLIQGFSGVQHGIATGDYSVVLRDMSPHIQHTFSGEHAFGGQRNDREALAEWFQRLHRVFPGMAFEIHDVVVQGMPWNTRAVVRWTERAPLRTGGDYVNDGMHYIRLRWGRVISMDVYLDTQLTARICAELAEHGLSEAVSAPITS